MKTNVLLILFTVALLLSSFNTKAQDYGNTEADSLKCLENVSLYVEAYDQKRYDDAYIPWKKAITICPKQSLNLYFRGIRMVKHKIIQAGKAYKKSKSEEDLAAYKSYLDTLFWVYDMQVEHFGNNPKYEKYNEGYILGRKAIDWLKYNRDKADALAMFEKSVEIKGSESQLDVLDKYFKLLKEMLDEEKISKEKFIDTYDLISEAIEYKLNHPSGSDKDTLIEVLDRNTWKIVEEVITCEDIVSIYGEKFEGQKENIKFLKKVAKMLHQKECQDVDLFYQSVKQLQALEPTSKVAFLAGEVAFQRKEYSEAVEYYKQAIELEELDRPKAKYYLKKGYAHIALGQYSSAKQAGFEASKIRPDWGMPYILIGDAYAVGSKTCGEGDGEHLSFTKKVGYWAAVDKFYKAKNVDPNLRELANKKINVYSGQFPKKEEAFFENLNDGDTYKVGCFINETTTVRTRK